MKKEFRIALFNKHGRVLVEKLIFRSKKTAQARAAKLNAEAERALAATGYEPWEWRVVQ